MWRLSDRKLLVLFIILFLSLLFRLLLFPIPGYKIDQQDFIYWFNFAAQEGIGNFYQPPNWSDYPPFNVYLFWAFGKLAKAIGDWSLLFFIKLPQNLLDLATAGVIFLLLSHLGSPTAGLVGAAVFAFNPGVIFNSAVWGQMDALYTFFLILSLTLLFFKQPELSSSSYALALLTKPQSLAFLPVFTLGILGSGIKRIVFSAISFLLTMTLVLLPFYPFSLQEEAPKLCSYFPGAVKFLCSRYLHGYQVYKYNSINAYNLWSVNGFWKPDETIFLGLSLQWWGILFFALLAGYLTWSLLIRGSALRTVSYNKALAQFSFVSFLLMFGFFMLMTRMHERYLFPAFAFLAINLGTVFFWEKERGRRLLYLLPLYIGLSLSYLANLWLILGFINADAFVPDNHWSFYILTPLNIVLFTYALWLHQRYPTFKGASPL